MISQETKSYIEFKASEIRDILLNSRKKEMGYDNVDLAYFEGVTDATAEFTKLFSHFEKK
jgi:hypothetical protein